MEVFGLAEDVFTLFRRFRHDLMNELQILSGHMQLGKSTEMLRGDLGAVVERIQEVSRIFSCRDDQLALMLWQWQEQARDREISISFDIDQLQAPIQIGGLTAAAALVRAAWEEIVRLDDEEHWMHVRVDGSTPALRLTLPIFPDTVAIRTLCPDQILPSVESDQQEYCFPLI